MKTGLWIVLGMAAVIVLVVVALAAGWALWGRPLWATGVSAAAAGCAGQAGGTWPGMMSGRGYGPEMMRGAAGPVVSGGCRGPAVGVSGTTPLSGTRTIEEARDAATQYISGLGYSNLKVVEVMEFEYNFYAIAQESDTGVGAMELLVDKQTGAVGPEMGPNMMWNARYGMHGRMMGGVSETNTITADEAKEIAQRWLDANRPGETVEDADPFYGYYTIHTMKDSQIAGMLSVHGSTGQVWYHTWHGQFVQALQED